MDRHGQRGKRQRRGAFTAALAGWRDEEGTLANLSSAFGCKADYKKETLAFTQEEFRDIIHQLLDFNKGLEENRFGDVEKGVAQTDLWYFKLAISDKKWGSQPVAFIPLFNYQGGVTAQICDFIAVNGNSENPAGAFWLLDYISSESQMQTSDLHMYLNSHGLSIYDELMQEETMLPYRNNSAAHKDPSNSIYFEERDWQAFTSAREKIDSADYPSEFDLEINLLLYNINETQDDTEKDKMIDDCYNKLTMLIGES